MNQNGDLFLILQQNDNGSLILLDAVEGKRLVFVSPFLFCKKNKLSPGILINGSIQKRNDYFLLTEFEIENSFFSYRYLAEYLLFFHHLFELCLVFLPFALPAPEIYDHMLFLYRSHRILKDLSQQKLFIGRLLFLLDIYHSADNDQEQRYLNLFSQPIDILIKEDIHLDEKILGRWLYHCVSLHPYSQYMKTIHFLQKMGNYESF